jgi:hypothetical protein
MRMKRYIGPCLAALSFVLPLALPALAGPREDVLRALGQCAAVADSTARLACYDRLAPQVKAALAPAPAQVAGPSPAPPQAETTPEQFGSERLPKTEAQQSLEKAHERDSITAKLADYAKNPFGKFIVVLANGQVWRQIQGDSGEAHFARTPSDNTVIISRAIFGSYQLRIAGSNKIFKVERLK